MSGLCKHAELVVNSSSHVTQTRYKRVDDKRRVAATQMSGRVPADVDKLMVSAGTFPAPLVLPGDDLAEDGRYPPQSLRSWHRGEHRNPVTKDRRTIYLVPPPVISGDVDFMRRWSRPLQPNDSSNLSFQGGSFLEPSVRHPSSADILGYMQAYFHGMEVKLLDSLWQFSQWDKSGKRQRPSAGSVALESAGVATRIRTRASLDGSFEAQLNLSDLLDACIESVPSDAYAVLLLVEQDMFEDEDDDFCCGRAYGGSRVAVVSTARYNPALDAFQDIDREHAWPASHCGDYIDSCCIGGSAKVRSKNSQTKSSPALVSAMQAAVEAHAALPRFSNKVSSEALQGLWLGRVCKTAVHELGHCLGMDHCVYFACLMQGTANVGEDARQPPFLCPVDLAKYTTASGAGIQRRYQALLAYCLSKPEIHLFAAFAAWIRVRLIEVDAAES